MFLVRKLSRTQPEAKEYNDTMQSATDPTQTTSSARNETTSKVKKKLNNGVMEGGVVGDRDKKITLSQMFIIKEEFCQYEVQMYCFIKLTKKPEKMTGSKTCPLQDCSYHTWMEILSCVASVFEKSV